MCEHEFAYRNVYQNKAYMRIYINTATHCSTLRYGTWLIQRTTTHCNTLQHPATPCNTLQHTATHCNTLKHTATHCNTLQHPATPCSTLHHTATHCNTLQHTATQNKTCLHTYIDIQLETSNKSSHTCKQMKSRFWTCHVTQAESAASSAQVERFSKVGLLLNLPY